MAWNAKTLFMLAAVTVITGCSDSDGEASKESQDTTALVKPLSTTEPATIKVLTSSAMDDLFMNTYFYDQVKKKYPHITIQPVTGAVSDTAKWVATGDIPDLVLDFNGGMADKINYDLLEDITPLVNKHKLDLNRFDPLILDAIKMATKNEVLYALPYSLNFNALYYNKDIFNKFGVAYPKDGMTWDQTIELAPKLTRLDNGVSYKGLHYEHVARLSMSLSPDFVNRKLERANVNNDMWKRVFELGQKINAIPGNRPEKIDSGYPPAFYTAQDTAMLASHNILNSLEEPIKKGFQLGIAQYPSYTEHPNRYGYIDVQVMYITKGSKYKEQALQVLEAVTSDEVQLAAARKLGRVSVLKNPTMKKEFGMDLAFMKGIDVQSVFKSSPAPAPAFSVYSLKARNILQAKYREFIEGKFDVNTALRSAEEEINKMIDAELKK